MHYICLAPPSSRRVDRLIVPNTYWNDLFPVTCNVSTDWPSPSFDGAVLGFAYLHFLREWFAVILSIVTCWQIPFKTAVGVPSTILWLKWHWNLVVLKHCQIHNNGFYSLLSNFQNSTNRATSHKNRNFGFVDSAFFSILYELIRCEVI